MGGECVKGQQRGGGSEEVVKTGRSLFQNSREHGGLHHSAASRNKERGKWENLLLAAWMLAMTERVVSDLSNRVAERTLTEEV